MNKWVNKLNHSHRLDWDTVSITVSHYPNWHHCMLQCVEFSVTKILSSWFLSLTTGVIYLWGEKGAWKTLAYTLELWTWKVGCHVYCILLLLTHWSCELEWLGVMYVVSCQNTRTEEGQLCRARSEQSACLHLSHRHQTHHLRACKSALSQCCSHFRVWGVWLGICTPLLKSQRVTVQWGLQQLLTVLEIYIMTDTCTYTRTYTWHACILVHRCMNAHTHTEKAKLRVCSTGSLTIL